MPACRDGTNASSCCIGPADCLCGKPRFRAVTEEQREARLVEAEAHTEALAAEVEKLRTALFKVERTPASRGRRQATSDTGYAFTLTQSPADGYTREDMVAAVEKLFEIGLTNAPSERSVSFCYAMEHPDTNFHIHGYYSTASGRRIAGQFFKRAWRIWDETMPLGKGHRGGYHKKVGDSSAYLEYCRKDSLEVTVLA